MRNPSATTSTKADSFRRVEVITGVGRRRRWSDQDKARVVAESLDPATTASAVARRYGLHASQLFTWRQQLHHGGLRGKGMALNSPGPPPIPPCKPRPHEQLGLRTEQPCLSPSFAKRTPPRLRHGSTPSRGRTRGDPGRSSVAFGDFSFATVRLDSSWL